MVGPSCDRIANEERCFHCVITNVLFPSEGRNEGRFERDVNKFVYKPTKWMTNSKALAQALGKRSSKGNEPPFHRHIVLNGGLAKWLRRMHPSL